MKKKKKIKELEKRIEELEKKTWERKILRISKPMVRNSPFEESIIRDYGRGGFVHMNLCRPTIFQVPNEESLEEFMDKRIGMTWEEPSRKKKLDKAILSVSAGALKALKQMSKSYIDMEKAVSKMDKMIKNKE